MRFMALAAVFLLCFHPRAVLSQGEQNLTCTGSDTVNVCSKNGTCPDGWTTVPYLEELGFFFIGTRCYKAASTNISEQMTYAEAQAACSNLDGYAATLPTITNYLEGTAVAIAAGLWPDFFSDPTNFTMPTNSPDVWLGLVQSATDKKNYTWDDGSVCNFGEFAHQFDGDPERCAHLSAGTGPTVWLDKRCSSTARAICQICQDYNVVTTSSSTTPPITSTTTTPEITTSSTTPTPTSTSSTPEQSTSSTTPVPTSTSTVAPTTSSSTTPQETTTSSTPEQTTSSTTPVPTTSTSTVAPTTSSSTISQETSTKQTTSSTTPVPHASTSSTQQAVTSSSAATSTAQATTTSTFLMTTSTATLSSNPESSTSSIPAASSTSLPVFMGDVSSSMPFVQTTVSTSAQTPVSSSAAIPVVTTPNPVTTVPLTNFTTPPPVVFENQTESNETIAARDLGQSLSTVVAVAVSTNVAISVATTTAVSVGASVATATTGSVASSATAGASSSGSTMTVLNQVQFLGIMSSVGGGETVAAYSESFGWALMDSPVSFDLGGLRSDDGSARRAKKTTGGLGLEADNEATNFDGECYDTGGLLLEKLVVACILMIVVFVLRNLCYFIVLAYSGLHCLELNFPAWEGPVAIFEFFPVSEIAAATFGQFCTGWSIVSVVVFMLGPGTLLVLSWHLVKKYRQRGRLNFEVHSSFDVRLKEIETKGESFWRLWFHKLHIRYMKFTNGGGWNITHSDARFWAFTFGDFRDTFFLFFAWQLLMKVLISVALHVLGGTGSAATLSLLYLVDMGMHSATRPFIDGFNNVGSTAASITNFLAVSALALPSIFPGVNWERVVPEFVAVAIATAGMIATLFVSTIKPAIAAVRQIFRLPCWGSILQIFAGNAILSAGVGTAGEGAADFMANYVMEEGEDHMHERVHGREIGVEDFERSASAQAAYERWQNEDLSLMPVTANVVPLGVLQKSASGLHSVFVAPSKAAIASASLGFMHLNPDQGNEKEHEVVADFDITCHNVAAKSTGLDPVVMSGASLFLRDGDNLVSMSGGTKSLTNKIRYQPLERQRKRRTIEVIIHMNKWYEGLLIEVAHTSRTQQISRLLSSHQAKHHNVVSKAAHLLSKPFRRRGKHAQGEHGEALISKPNASWNSLEGQLDGDLLKSGIPRLWESEILGQGHGGVTQVAQQDVDYDPFRSASPVGVAGANFGLQSQGESSHLATRSGQAQTLTSAVEANLQERRHGISVAGGISLLTQHYGKGKASRRPSAEKAPSGERTPEVNFQSPHEFFQHAITDAAQGVEWLLRADQIHIEDSDTNRIVVTVRDTADIGEMVANASTVANHLVQQIENPTSRFNESIRGKFEIDYVEQLEIHGDVSMPMSWKDSVNTANILLSHSPRSIFREPSQLEPNGSQMDLRSLEPSERRPDLEAAMPTLQQDMRDEPGNVASATSMKLKRRQAENGVVIAVPLSTKHRGRGFESGKSVPQLPAGNLYALPTGTATILRSALVVGGPAGDRRLRSETSSLRLEAANSYVFSPQVIPGGSTSSQSSATAASEEQNSDRAGAGLAISINKSTKAMSFSPSNSSKNSSEGDESLLNDALSTIYESRMHKIQENVSGAQKGNQNERVASTSPIAYA